MSSIPHLASMDLANANTGQAAMVEAARAWVGDISGGEAQHALLTRDIFIDHVLTVVETSAAERGQECGVAAFTAHLSACVRKTKHAQRRPKQLPRACEVVAYIFCVGVIGVWCWIMAVR